MLNICHIINICTVYITLYYRHLFTLENQHKKSTTHPIPQRQASLERPWVEIRRWWSQDDWSHRTFAESNSRLGLKSCPLGESQWSLRKKQNLLQPSNQHPCSFDFHDFFSSEQWLLEDEHDVTAWLPSFLTLHPCIASDRRWQQCQLTTQIKDVWEFFQHSGSWSRRNRNFRPVLVYAISRSHCWVAQYHSKYSNYVFIYIYVMHTGPPPAVPLKGYHAMYKHIRRPLAKGSAPRSLVFKSESIGLQACESFLFRSAMRSKGDVSRVFLTTVSHGIGFLFLFSGFQRQRFGIFLAAMRSVGFWLQCVPSVTFRTFCYLSVVRSKGDVSSVFVAFCYRFQ